MSTKRIVITCSPKLSTVVKKEVEALGYENIKVSYMSVELQGTYKDAMRLNLMLRTGNRVLFQIADFKANQPDQLYKNIKQIPWEDYMDANGYFSIKSHVTNDYIQDTQYASLRVKDAIADRFNEKFDQRPDAGKDLSKTVFFLHWQLNEASIYIDTSGETIAKHGYRKIPMNAPMMESLAAATILSSTWDQKSTFINPMCGSGTLAIEAALIATKKIPALKRENFGFMHTKLYDESEWEVLKTEAIKSEQNNIDFKIIATDNNPAAIVAARQNALAAGVEDLITFKTCDFLDTEIPDDKKGVVFLNPEYGQRLGEEQKLVAVYKNIGDFFKQKCKGYFGYIFTGNLNLAKKIGLRANRRMEFFNARIDCRLLEYELYDGSKKKS